MGFVIEILSDRRLNLAVQIGSRLTRTLVKMKRTCEPTQWP